MVDVVQLVERQFVVLVVVGSSPIVHPIGMSLGDKKILILLFIRLLWWT